MVGPFVTKAADSQAGGAAIRSVPHEPPRAAHTTAAPTVSSSPKGAASERARQVRFRPGLRVRDAPAHEPGRKRLGFQFDWGTWRGLSQEPIPVRRNARIDPRSGRRRAGSPLEYSTSPGDTGQP